MIIDRPAKAGLFSGASTHHAADVAQSKRGEIMAIMTNEQIRKNFVEGNLTWADLLVITGLPEHILYEILSDYF